MSEGPQPRKQHRLVRETAAETIGQTFPYLLNANGECDPALWGDDVPLELSRERLYAIARSRYSSQPPDAAKALDDGFRALRALHEQLDLACNTSVTRTDGVCVEASSAFCGTMVQNAKPLWVFSYKLRIRNEGTEPIRLLARHWLIKNADGTVHAEVPRWGAGVVGQTPVIEPSACFEYASGSTLSQPGGSIEGGLQLTRHGSLFEAPIDSFPLLVGPTSPP